MRPYRTSDLARSALVRLLLALDGRTDDLTVVGGLTPPFLTEPVTPPHRGTADVDLYLEVGVVYDRDDLTFGWLEAGLRRAGFTPVRDDIAWQWAAHVAGAAVRLDVLCDALDSPGRQIALPGCDALTAMNVAGPGGVGDDRVRRDLPVSPEDRAAVGLTGDDPSTVTVPFAGLGGYLLTKSAALLGRSAAKDVYDLAFVLLHSTAGGPEALARTMLRAVPQRQTVDHLGSFRAALRRLVETDAADVYAAQRVLEGDRTPAAVIAADVVTAATLCLDALAAPASGDPPAA
ncbi:hypothetical protein [Cellulomonas oligotrophica]|uniref:Uncharacterized protein n=1 Tax=Cellulomonas oligotrophica TaxID=931536 RepID=A0A7Y9FH41_9CELL|nr:hypothetical protein [Cellulomonas oligotrophica]NYD86812.1 hypothetical protein [Cellulomonas oligotrophica]GIG32403.1 hypothetical protein Col01nite_15620 [Cellulomonas oligotrophica]